MLKKHLFIALLLALAANHASAQVYTIHAKYSLLSIYIGEYHQLSFDIIDTGRNYTLIADFDKKLITDPTDYESPLPITEIVHEEGSMFYFLKVKPNKYLKWCFYKLMVNHLGEPVYIQETDQQKGRDQRRDTFFHTYTSNLATLSFYEKCARIKDTTLTGDSYSAGRQIAGLTKKRFRFEDNVVEMRDGYINWKNGKESHHLDITEVQLIKEDGSDGIVVRCHERDGEYYDFTYVKSNRKIELDQFGKELFIMIEKWENKKKVQATILL